jgi:hypothetical protein
MSTNRSVADEGDSLKVTIPHTASLRAVLRFRL